MSIRKKRGICTYCGQEKNLTKDHVPPKALLERPYPRNLVTVPSCAACNESFAKDDEYTRTVIGLDVRASRNSAAQFQLPAIFRSLNRKDARGFADYLFRQSTDTTVLGATGIPLGRVIVADRDRVNNTGKRLLRGLYYSETGKRINSDATVLLESKAGLTAEHPDMLTIARVFKFVTDRRDRAFGKAFSYVAGFNQAISVWLMLLYDYFFWVGTVDERAIEERNEPILPAAPIIL